MTDEDLGIFTTVSNVSTKPKTTTPSTANGSGATNTSGLYTHVDNIDDSIPPNDKEQADIVTPGRLDDGNDAESNVVAGGGQNHGSVSNQAHIANDVEENVAGANSDVEDVQECQLDAFSGPTTSSAVGVPQGEEQTAAKVHTVTKAESMMTFLFFYAQASLLITFYVVWPVANFCLIALPCILSYIKTWHLASKRFTFAKDLYHIPWINPLGIFLIITFMLLLISGISSMISILGAGKLDDYINKGNKETTKYSTSKGLIILHILLWGSTVACLSALFPSVATELRILSFLNSTENKIYLATSVVLLSGFTLVTAIYIMKVALSAEEKIGLETPNPQSDKVSNEPSPEDSRNSSDRDQQATTTVLCKKITAMTVDSPLQQKSLAE